jgi:hypothetical protein
MKKGMLVVSMVLLTIMIIFPLYMLIESWNEDLTNLGQQSTPLDQTGIQSYFADATVRHQTLLTILAVGEVVLLVLFILTFRMAIRP